LFASLREEFRELGQDVVAKVAPYQSKGFWPRISNVVWANRNQADVNHITGDVHYFAMGLRKERTILTIHDCFQLERLRGIKRLIMRIVWFDWPMRRSAIITVVSEETKRQLLRYVGIPPSKIVVIPDAVAPIFRPYPKQFRSECPQILHIGTKPNKNLSRLIQAVQGLRCHVKIVGVLNDVQRRELDTSGISYDAEGNLGDSGMYRAYCDADLVCFASVYEGFGMPIVEAQWVERPVVTSNCSSMPEVAGGAACLVDPFDAASIREGIRRVMEDDAYRQRLIELGRENRERFSLEQVARQYGSLYAKLMPDRTQATLKPAICAE
jgi:glycosyltransferase involved in cell wall biosynthesis